MDQRSLRSYAQNLEDIVVWRALHGVRKDCYLDIGPDEPVHELTLSDSCGELDFFLAQVNGLSTGVARNAMPGSRSCRVDMRTLALFGHGWPAPEVHWMKVDVEGMEASVLRGWDPSLLRPWILLVEATRPNSTEQNHPEWEHLMLEAVGGTP